MSDKASNHPDLLEPTKARIRTRIDALGWTIAETAHRAGLPASNLSTFLGTGRDLRSEAMLRLLAVLGAKPLAWHVPSGQSAWPDFARAPTPAQRERRRQVLAIADEIERAMRRAGLTQTQLAEASGIHLSAISRVLTRRSLPSETALAALRGAIESAGKAAREKKGS